MTTFEYEHYRTQMNFMKEITIYENKNMKVYINQCFNKGKKTKCYAVRKDDDTALADLLGLIKWSGSWRQYVFYPVEKTKLNN